jgi:hypothetical protein
MTSADSSHAQVRLGDILVAQGPIDQVTLERALRLQNETGERNDAKGHHNPADIAGFTTRSQLRCRVERPVFSVHKKIICEVSRHGFAEQLVTSAHPHHGKIWCKPAVCSSTNLRTGSINKLNVVPISLEKEVACAYEAAIFDIQCDSTHPTRHRHRTHGD